MWLRVGLCRDLTSHTSPPCVSGQMGQSWHLDTLSLTSFVDEDFRQGPLMLLWPAAMVGPP